MFERYTERARRVIFFARYEASQTGDAYIETQHLLLGLLRQDAGVLLDFITHEQALSIRQQIESEAAVRNQGRKLDTSVDLPLSNESKRVLAYSAEEAERLRDPHIGVEHMLLGLLREQGTFAAKLLTQRGVELAKVRQHLKSQNASRVHDDKPDLEQQDRGRAMPDYAEFVDVETDNRVGFVAVHPNYSLPQASDFILLQLTGRMNVRYQVIEVIFQYRARAETSPDSIQELQKITIRVRRADEPKTGFAESN